MSAKKSHAETRRTRREGTHGFAHAERRSRGGGPRFVAAVARGNTRLSVSRVNGEQIRVLQNRYGSATFTRKKRLAAFVGPQEPLVKLSRPSTV